MKYYFIVICKVCDNGYGCDEFPWQKNSQEDGEFYNSKEEAEEAAIKYIDGAPSFYRIYEDQP